MAKNGNIHPKRIFKTPEDLEQVWEEYKDDLKNQALEWVKIQYVGKEAQRMEDPYKLPYTMDGFEVFCYKKYGCVNQYFDNKQDYYDDFVTICSHIKKEIRSNQITGGLLGVYNPSITQRLNGIKEQTDITSGGEKLQSTPSAINVRIIENNDDE
jgi:hypothetical protein